MNPSSWTPHSHWQLRAGHGIAEWGWGVCGEGAQSNKSPVHPGSAVQTAAERLSGRGLSGKARQAPKDGRNQGGLPGRDMVGGPRRGK